MGGAAAAVMTDITFNAKHIDWLIAHHDGAPVARRRKRKAAGPVRATEAEPMEHDAAEPRLGRKADPTAIPPGALTATMEQTEAALGLSRGTVII